MVEDFMKKICVIFTGGTIGSTVGESINVNETQKTILLEHFYENYEGEDVEIETMSPLYTLSENMTCEKWEVLVNAVSEAQTKDYDGIIVTHGTDSLAYTSCMLGFMFANTDIPIVVVSSNKPLTDDSANGHHNFMSAVNFIVNAQVRGVYVAFRDRKKSDNIHIATRLTQAMQITGEVFSANLEPFGRMAGSHFLPNKVDNPTVKEVNSKKIVLPGNSARFSNEFILIKPYVGLNYEFFHSKYKAKFILHELYHSGTACVEGKNTSLIEYSKYCKQNNIDLYIAPISSSQGEYESLKELLDNNVKILRGMSLEASLVKLMIAYGRYSSNKIRETFIEQDLFFEYMN